MSVKSGQIAHLDQNNQNSSEGNLAFLCLDHHNEYDGRTRQSKGFTIGEVKAFRDELYGAEELRAAAESSAVDPQIFAEGGRGGSGEIFGSGTIIGGRGGRVGAGGQGRGGDGGGGVIHGDGLIIGGEGGSVDGPGIWYPPARSAFEHFLAQQGETPDWGVMYPGYGGMSGGYLERHLIVSEIREKFFSEHGMMNKISRRKIDDVPIDYINSEMKGRKLNWRAVKEGYWYLYQVPSE